MFVKFFEKYYLMLKKEFGIVNTNCTATNNSFMTRKPFLKKKGDGIAAFILEITYFF